MNNQDVLILVVEDEQQQRELIVSLLSASNYQVISADCVEQAILLLKEQPVDLVFSDWKLGKLSGIDLLNYVRNKTTIKASAEHGFIIATAHGTISHAVEALKQGADDYIAKPFQRQELLLTIEKALTAKSLRLQNLNLNQQLGEQNQLIGLVGKAPCMQKVYQRIERVSATNATILILGETGTGKELAARALHQSSDRKNKPFIAINCGAITDSLAESELFGAEKGAYTGANTTKIGKFEAANHGTVFLDEVGELSLNTQVKLLRFLQEGTITRVGSNKELTLDVRVIAATHRDLDQEVKTGQFREDLFYRLNIVPINMPALRDRSEDIASLCEHFLSLHSKRHNINIAKLSASAYRSLLEYHWPGNVRELSNRLERFVLLDDEQELISALHVPDGQNCDNTPDFSFPDESFSWDSFEQQCLASALSKNHGNRTKAAKHLQMSYKAFLYRLEKYQLNK
ncbi:sigma-54 dependent transcriptional regulator [Thalassotalea nanhaiensis]|uniref:Sigma-54 dependent transcriptional regulator n=1 Tax=Thalassotalea nanhaiensis TaxID=3065648 RepID=A0ABY9TND7_9GAMM|nr:sigma-54 dependent transcriptional regulator [Colwelliaceae bacterium SQ345]